MIITVFFLENLTDWIFIYLVESKKFDDFITESIQIRFAHLISRVLS